MCSTVYSHQLWIQADEVVDHFWRQNLKYKKKKNTKIWNTIYIYIFGLGSVSALKKFVGKKVNQVTAHPWDTYLTFSIASFSKLSRQSSNVFADAGNKATKIFKESKGMSLVTAKCRRFCTCLVSPMDRSNNLIENNTEVRNLFHAGFLDNKILNFLMSTA